MNPDPLDNADIRAALEESGIVLPEEDIAFLEAQLPMLARTIRAVGEAA